MDSARWNNLIVGVQWTSIVVVKLRWPWSGAARFNRGGQATVTVGSKQ